MSKSTSIRKTVFHWLMHLDRILRGEATRPQDIRKGNIRIPVVGVSIVVIALAIFYGSCMGIFSLVRAFETGVYNQALMQTFASMSKVPLLFVLTLIITFPSLYVFNALVGSQLKMGPVLKLLVASLAVNLAVLASLGPILAFFSVSTPNYPFIVLLNVVMFTIAGGLGLSFLVQTLHRLTLAYREQLPTVTKSTRTIQPDEQVVDATLADPSTAHVDTPVASDYSGPLDRLDGAVSVRGVRTVFACWIIVFGLVGAQMGWVLRPFIGAPGQPFQWFRPRDSNFFQAVGNTMYNLFF